MLQVTDFSAETIEIFTCIKTSPYRPCLTKFSPFDMKVLRLFCKPSASHENKPREFARVSQLCQRRRQLGSLFLVMIAV
jgi:hypothetical protein